MEIFDIKNLSFSYNKALKPALSGINLQIYEGEFLLIIGESGCGKTTLLRMLKKELTPFGKTEGEILFKGKPSEQLSKRESAESIGFIMQDPDSQIVTDRVYSELAFGLESLGVNPRVIRSRVSEFSSYFGLSDSFERKTDSLSGGEKQLLNLASVMCMNPDVIILDEPTSMLDPISAIEFINTLRRLNEDFGVTVIIVEHHLQELFGAADRVVYMENGAVALTGAPSEISTRLSDKKILSTLPVPVRVFSAIGCTGSMPLNVRDGRRELGKLCFRSSEYSVKEIKPSEIVLSCRDVRFRYEKKSPDVLKDCNLSVSRGLIYSVVGANGSGKSTLLKILCGILKPYHGRVKAQSRVSYLPQNPKDIFVKDKLEDDFKLINNSYTELCERFGITELLGSHPYDLSGGELQRAAICKLMLTNPEILLLDEPTKGLDGLAKKNLGDFLRSLCANGRTVLLVTHDLEFAAEFSDYCGLLFDGEITSEGETCFFFSSNNFYTTAAARMSRGVLKNAVTAQQIISLYGGLG